MSDVFDWAQIDADGLVVNVFRATTEQLTVIQDSRYQYVLSTDTNTAAKDGRYFADTNEYAPPAPYPSWSFNMTSRRWVAPKPKPSDETWIYITPAGFDYEQPIWVWNETSLSWVDTRPA